jgi:hypothetical protein
MSAWGYVRPFLVMAIFWSFADARPPAEASGSLAENDS